MSSLENVTHNAQVKLRAKTIARKEAAEKAAERLTDARRRQSADQRQTRGMRKALQAAAETPAADTTDINQPPSTPPHQRCNLTNNQSQ